MSEQITQEAEVKFLDDRSNDPMDKQSRGKRAATARRHLREQAQEREAAQAAAEVEIVTTEGEAEQPEQVEVPVLDEGVFSRLSALAAGDGDGVTITAGKQFVQPTQQEQSEAVTTTATSTDEHGNVIEVVAEVLAPGEGQAEQTGTLEVVPAEQRQYRPTQLVTAPNRTNIWQQVNAALPDPDNMSAVEALHYFGKYETQLIPLYADLPDDGGEPVRTDTGYRGIYTENQQGKLVQIGLVTTQYQPLQPQQFCNLWDDNLGLKLNAMGAAGRNGETFFLSHNLGPMKIGGRDEYDMFLTGFAPQNGDGAIVIKITPVRLVCTNMVHAAQSRAAITIKIPHKGDVLDTVGKWMKNLSEAIWPRRKMVKADLTRMLETGITSEMITTYVHTLYALPEPLKLEGPRDLTYRRMNEREYQRGLLQERQNTLRSMIEGRTWTGADLVGDQADSVYGMFQAATEMAQYSKGGGAENRGQSALVGPRAEQMNRAFVEALRLTGVEVSK